MYTLKCLSKQTAGEKVKIHLNTGELKITETMPSYQLRLQLALIMKHLLIKRQPVLKQSKLAVSPSVTERSKVEGAQSSLFY